MRAEKSRGSWIPVTQGSEAGWAPPKTRTKPETTPRDLHHVGPCTAHHNDSGYPMLAKFHK